MPFALRTRFSFGSSGLELLPGTVFRSVSTEMASAAGREKRSQKLRRFAESLRDLARVLLMRLESDSRPPFWLRRYRPLDPPKLGASDANKVDDAVIDQALLQQQTAKCHVILLAADLLVTSSTLRRVASSLWA